MDATHFHLLLNHFPIIGMLIGTITIIYGFITKEFKIKTLAALMIVVMALISIPVYLTGEPAEESIEHLNGISESSIELHEEAAEFAFILMLITGILALISIILSKKKPELAHKTFFVLLVFSFLSFVSMARVGFLGGKIRHTELNNKMSSQSSEMKEPNQED